MDQRTRDALEGSIEKWRKIAACKGEDHGTNNCPLCLMFYKKVQLAADDGGSWTGRCHGCPVYENTELHCCDGTPYDAWVQSCDTPVNQWNPPDYTAEQIAAAQAELDFLISLRLGEGE